MLVWHLDPQGEGFGGYFCSPAGKKCRDEARGFEWANVAALMIGRGLWGR